MSNYQPPATPLRSIDPTDPVSVAADILARISSYDATAPVATEELLTDWANSIYAAGVDYQFLVEGVHKVFVEAGGDPPKKKLAAVITEAKAARAKARQGEALRQLAPALGTTITESGYALEAAYEVDQAITLPCRDVATEAGTQPGCGAEPGEFCTHGDRIKKIPCGARLIAARRENNPTGRQAHEQRQAHLHHHRRTYQAAYKQQRTP